MTEAPKQAAEVQYACPMHTEINRAEPGPCPICGMALEPRDVAADEGSKRAVALSRSQGTVSTMRPRSRRLR